QSRLTGSPGAQTMDATVLVTVTSVANVKAAAGTLSLSNVTFSGQLPDQSSKAARATQGEMPPAGGADGAGGSSFDVKSFTVMGVDPAATAVGPISAVALTEGRGLSASDVGQPNAVLDAAYATTSSLTIGGTLDIGGTSFTIVGLVGSTSGDSASASNVYIPLDLAQSISGETGKISHVYVQAASSSDITQIQTDIKAALPDTTVSTQADLAATVSGSLATASSMLESLGLWLSIAVLIAAFLTAILFTVSGVTRRTREFGTLKAIGWSNRRIMGQVAGESVVQGLIGGALGIILGIVGVVVINVIAPTLSGSASAGSAPRMGGAAMRAAGDASGAGGGFGGGGRALSQAASVVTLNAPLTLSIILIAVGLAVLGGLLAGAIGGWRASRLSPAEALRSVD
ncbi:MAG: ABC transporter permease, partial [Actinomycetales bacterium]|nr:ABC transporter permease [Actinomycetales bacterium]